MKKFSWEVEKASLILRVTDGAKETTWKLRKNMPGGVLLRIFEELQLAMWTTEPVHPTEPAAVAEAKLYDMDEPVGPVVADTEEASKAFLAAKAAAATAIGGEWWRKDSYERPETFNLGHGEGVD